MGAHMGSDSGSEADIQHPTKKHMEVTEIPDSDVEDAQDVVPMSSNTTKLKGIIEHISADSDDDDQPDDPVDFGEEEEEEESPPSPKASTPENKGVEEKEKEDVEEMELDDDENETQTKTADKKTASPSSSKSRPRKAPNARPSKTIKKPSTVKKEKAKVPKKTTAIKKSASLLKTAAKGSSSPKSKPADKGSPKAQKRSTAKTVSKVGSKASPKAVKKKDIKQAVQKSKSVKPRKTIDKATMQGKEKALLKQKDKPKTPVKTFSKKWKINSKDVSVQSGKERKTKSPRADSIKKQKTPKKIKGKKSAKEAEDEEDSGEVENTSEGEVTDASSGGDEDEIMCTPTSKLPIIGSLACSSRDANAQALLDHAVQQLGKYRAVNYGPDSDVNLHAYIISADTKRGWGVLQALASGAQMVSADWLSSSISEGSWQPMSAYLSDRFGKSPRSISGGDVPNRILEGLRIRVVCEGQDAPSVRKLVTLCGGRVAETRVNVTINDTGKESESGTNVTKKWLADSVESGVALEYQPYMVESG